MIYVKFKIKMLSTYFFNSFLSVKFKPLVKTGKIVFILASLPRF